MVFNPTSFGCSKIRKARRCAGFTLAEVSIAIAIASIVALALGGTLIYCARSMAALNNYIALDRGSRNALDILMADVRQVKAVASYVGSSFTNASEIVLPMPHTATVTYRFDATDETFHRIQGTNDALLLKNCVGHFEMYKAVNHDWDQYPASDSLQTCKVLQVNWKCTRKILGTIANTEDVVTAKIVMRN